MATAPPLDPATHCPGCGAPIPRVQDRFCPGCGSQLMRPDLRARRVNHGDGPPPSARELASDPGAHPRHVPPTAAAPPAGAPSAMPLTPAAWPSPASQPVAPALAPPATSRGLAGALGAAVVLALLGVAATVIFAVSGHDPATPTVPNGMPPTVTAAP